MNEIERHTVMESEVCADCYSGETCDQVSKHFRTYCDGDMDSYTHKDDLTIRLSDLPPGARITVTYPCCPECSLPREDKFEHLPGGVMKIVGHHSNCECGFDWDEWVLDQYS